MTPCARHHLAWGQHAPGCTCTPDCPDHEGHCTGCLPVEASNGLLCSTCSRRLRGFLGAEEGLDPEHPVHGLPWAWEHLEVAYPSLSQVPGDGGGSGPADREAERLASVVSLRDDIGDVLAAWAEAVADEAGLPGGRVIVHPDRTTGKALDYRGRMRRRAEWLLVHVETLEASEAVGDAWQELADLMSRAHALAPWRPAPTHLDGIPCRCGAVALHDHGDEILCWSCRHSYSREEFRVLTKVFGRRYADDPRAAGAVERPRLERSTAGTGGRP